MRNWWPALAAFLSLAAAPALATPCTTKGEAEVAIAFPANDASDVAFARSMVPVLLPHTSGTLPPALTCTRSTVSTPLGDYAIGGENGDAFPRLAMRADGKAGPIVYLARASGKFALVVHRPGTTAIVRFYAAIPTDRLLAEDLRAALAGEAGIIVFDAKQKMVSYEFAPTGGVPPPVAPGARDDGSQVAAGPQIFIPDTGHPRFLDMDRGMRHRPSGFACPQVFDGLAVLLMSIDPRADYLACSYRPGTSLQLSDEDEIRYQLTLIKPGRSDTPRSLFEALTTEARAGLRITGDRAPPFATGPSPAPEFVAYWNTEGDGVQGVWVGKAGGWIVWLRAQYPPSAANDAEAGNVARTLFMLLGKQVK